MHKGIVGLVFIGISLNLCFSQATSQIEAFTLEAAVDYALQHHNQMKNASLDMEIANAQMKDVRSMGLPQVNATIGYQNFPAIPVQLVPAEFFGGEPGEFAELKFGTPHNASFALTASQLIFNGSYFVGLQAASTYAKLAEKQKEQTALDIKYNVHNAFYGALIAQANYKQIASSTEKVKTLLEDTKAMKEAGLAEQLDVDRIQLSYNDLNSQLMALEQRKALLLALLKFQMGYDQEQTLNLKGTIDDLSIGTKEQPTVDLEQHIDYQVLTIQEELTALNLKNFKSQYLPSVMATANYGQNAMRDEFNFFNGDLPWFESFVWGINIQIPIFDGLQKSAKIQEQKLNLKKIDNSKSMLVDGLKIGLNQGYVDYSIALEQLKSKETNSQLSQSIYNTVKAKYKEGLASSFELIQAETDWVGAQTAVYNSYYDVVVAKSALSKASGK